MQPPSIVGCGGPCESPRRYPTAGVTRDEWASPGVEGMVEWAASLSLHETGRAISISFSMPGHQTLSLGLNFTMSR